MGKRKVIWTKNAEIQMFSIMDYYFERNKSNHYSLKLYKDISQKLQKLHFNITLPQKTNKKGLFYFTHNHISVFFSIELDLIVVKLIWDERRNPDVLTEKLADI